MLTFSIEPDGVAESLAELLHKHRLAVRLSQEALAERAGISARTVSDMETGVARTPRLMTLMLLAEALGLGEDDRVRFQAAGRRREPEAAPGPPGAPGIPAPRAPVLVGRSLELERLSEMLRAEGARLVTLVGPAGVGKTSLAIRGAYEQAAAFEHGTALVELAATRDPALVPAALAHALGVREGDGSARDAVLAYLKDRNVLLVLDNLEHLTPASSWIGELLAGCARLTMIVTSREPLHLRSEVVFALRPLAEREATDLFVQRARTVKPDFAVTEETIAAIATIVQHLEGLPLAIELAAARLSALPPKALAARLERRLPLLGAGPIDAPQRQQTMQAAIAWSYDLLGPDEQALFRRLGVFRGGASLDAARAVAAGHDDEHAFLMRTASLVEKSLLSLDEDRDGEPRIAMLELLREFAHQRLVEMEELEAARERHARAALQITATYQAEYSSAQARALRRIDRDHANLLAALEWALEVRNVDIGLELTGALWRFWWMRGYFSEGIVWLRRFLDLAADAATPVDAPGHAKAMHGLAALLSASGRFEDALAYCEIAIDALRGTGEELGLAALLTMLGTIRQFRGELDRSEAAHLEALEIRRRAGAEIGIAGSLSNLAALTFTQGDIDRAEAYALESVARYRRTGYQSGLAHALLKVGLVTTHRGELERAEAVYDECLSIQERLGDKHGRFYSLANLAVVAQKRGDTARALSLHRKALDILDTIADQAGLAKLLEDMAMSIGIDRPERAIRILAAAGVLRRALGTPRFPAERADYEANIESLRTRVGQATFDTQWQIGEVMPIERAVQEARTEETRAVEA